MQTFESAFETIRRESDLACSEAAVSARRTLSSALNQFLRRLRQYGNEDEWISAVIDGASQFAGQVAVFVLKSDSFLLKAQVGLNLDPHLSFPMSSSAAFAGVVASKDPAVALRTPGEVSEALSSAGPGDRAQIIPISNGPRVVAILFSAVVDETDLAALEFVAGVASVVLERQANAVLHSKIASVSQPFSGPASLPAWAELSEVERNLHMRAQRFARAAVAEMQLSHPEACQAGRDQSNLYVYLKNDIDKARDGYRNSFMNVHSMIDYLHLELVNVAAESDESKLGADYPGRLSH